MSVKPVSPEEFKAFVVEHGVPIPKRSGPTKYPFHEMNVHDSFFTIDRKAIKAASTYGKRNKMTFCYRAVDGGFRIWRTA